MWWINCSNRCRCSGVRFKNSIPMPSSGSISRTFPCVLTEPSAARSSSSTRVWAGKGDWVRRKHPPKLSPTREQRMGGSCFSPDCRCNHSFRLWCETSESVGN